MADSFDTLIGKLDGNSPQAILLLGNDPNPSAEKVGDQVALLMELADEDKKNARLNGAAPEEIARITALEERLYAANEIMNNNAHRAAYQQRYGGLTNPPPKAGTAPVAASNGMDDEGIMGRPILPDDDGIRLIGDDDFGLIPIEDEGIRIISRPSGKYWSPQDAADFMGITPDELRTLRESSKIRGFADRGAWKFKGEDVDTYLAQRSIPPAIVAPDVADTPRPTAIPALPPADGEITHAKWMDLHRNSSSFTYDNVHPLDVIGATRYTVASEISRLADQKIAAIDTADSWGAADIEKVRAAQALLLDPAALARFETEAVAHTTTQIANSNRDIARYSQQIADMRAHEPELQQYRAAVSAGNALDYDKMRAALTEAATKYPKGYALDRIYSNLDYAQETLLGNQSILDRFRNIAAPAANRPVLSPDSDESLPIRQASPDDAEAPAQKGMVSVKEAARRIAAAKGETQPGKSESDKAMKRYQDIKYLAKHGIALTPDDDGRPWVEADRLPAVEQELAQARMVAADEASGAARVALIKAQDAHGQIKHRSGFARLFLGDSAATWKSHAALEEAQARLTAAETAYQNSVSTLDALEGRTTPKPPVAAETAPRVPAVAADAEVTSPRPTVTPIAPDAAPAPKPTTAATVDAPATTPKPVRAALMQRAASAVGLGWMFSRTTPAAATPVTPAVDAPKAPVAVTPASPVARSAGTAPGITYDDWVKLDRLTTSLTDDGSIPHPRDVIKVQAGASADEIRARAANIIETIKLDDEALFADNDIRRVQSAERLLLDPEALARFEAETVQHARAAIPTIEQEIAQHRATIENLKPMHAEAHEKYRAASDAAWGVEDSYAAIKEADEAYPGGKLLDKAYNNLEIAEGQLRINKGTLNNFGDPQTTPSSARARAIEAQRAANPGWFAADGTLLDAPTTNPLQAPSTFKEHLARLAGQSTHEILGIAPGETSPEAIQQARNQTVAHLLAELPNPANPAAPENAAVQAKAMAVHSAATLLTEHGPQYAAHTAAVAAAATPAADDATPSKKITPATPALPDTPQGVTKALADHRAESKTVRTAVKAMVGLEIVMQKELEGAHQRMDKVRLSLYDTAMAQAKTDKAQQKAARKQWPEAAMHRDEEAALVKMQADLEAARTRLAELDKQGVELQAREAELKLAEQKKVAAAKNTAAVETAWETRKAAFDTAQKTAQDADKAAAAAEAKAQQAKAKLAAHENLGDPKTTALGKDVESLLALEARNTKRSIAEAKGSRYDKARKWIADQKTLTLAVNNADAVLAPVQAKAVAALSDLETAKGVFEPLDAARKALAPTATENPNLTTRITTGANNTAAYVHRSGGAAMNTLALYNDANHLRHMYNTGDDKGLALVIADASINGVALSDDVAGVLRNIPSERMAKILDAGKAIRPGFATKALPWLGVAGIVTNVALGQYLQKQDETFWAENPDLASLKKIRFQSDVGTAVVAMGTGMGINAAGNALGLTTTVTAGGTVVATGGVVATGVATVAFAVPMAIAIAGSELTSSVIDQVSQAEKFKANMETKPHLKSAMARFGDDKAFDAFRDTKTKNINWNTDALRLLREKIEGEIELNHRIITDYKDKDGKPILSPWAATAYNMRPDVAITGYFASVNADAWNEANMQHANAQSALKEYKELQTEIGEGAVKVNAAPRAVIESKLMATGYILQDAAGKMRQDNNGNFLFDASKLDKDGQGFIKSAKDQAALYAAFKKQGLSTENIAAVLDPMIAGYNSQQKPEITPTDYLNSLTVLKTDNISDWKLAHGKNDGKPVYIAKNKSYDTKADALDDAFAFNKRVLGIKPVADLDKNTLGLNATEIDGKWYIATNDTRLNARGDLARFQQAEAHVTASAPAPVTTPTPPVPTPVPVPAPPVTPVEADTTSEAAAKKAATDAETKKLADKQAEEAKAKKKKEEEEAKKGNFFTKNMWPLIAGLGIMVAGMATGMTSGMGLFMTGLVAIAAFFITPHIMKAFSTDESAKSPEATKARKQSVGVLQKLETEVDGVLTEQEIKTKLDKNKDGRVMADELDAEQKKAFALLLQGNDKAAPKDAQGQITEVVLGELPAQTVGSKQLGKGINLNG